MKFEVGGLRNCPPSDAEAATRNLYRTINGNTATARDFVSHAKGGRADASVCQAWGLSVWCTLEAAFHARKVIPAIRKKRIAKFPVGAADGLLKATPSNSQPDHHTFWLSLSAKLLPVCVVAFVPPKDGDNGV